MATPLAKRHCVACKPGSPSLPREEIDRLLEQVSRWDVEEADGHLRLTRTVKFKGFMPGVELVDRIAPIAEAERHHPDLLLTYGSLSVWLWTHAAGGLTENDFILAARIDQAVTQTLN
jgi:4a-hydroxytetrahydrobiopterin dehydratase